MRTTPTAMCDHPESSQYVLALDEEANARAVLQCLDGLIAPAPATMAAPGLRVPTILWCRSCGAVHGWRPADEPSEGEWQLPDAAGGR